MTAVLSFSSVPRVKGARRRRRGERKRRLAGVDERDEVRLGRTELHGDRQRGVHRFKYACAVKGRARRLPATPAGGNRAWLGARSDLEPGRSGRRCAIAAPFRSARMTTIGSGQVHQRLGQSMHSDPAAGSRRRRRRACPLARGRGPRRGARATRCRSRRGPGCRTRGSPTCRARGRRGRRSRRRSSTRMPQSLCITKSAPKRRGEAEGADGGEAEGLDPELVERARCRRGRLCRSRACRRAPAPRRGRSRACPRRRTCRARRRRRSGRRCRSARRR